MSLVNCPECEHVVSTYAIACPNCGFPMELAPQLLAGETVPAVSAEPSHAPLSVGSFVSLGRWGGIELEWRVLHVEEDRALMVTEDGIECLPYNDKESNVTWETCSLRAWLNGPFLQGAFTSAERNRLHILDSSVPAEEGVIDYTGLDKVFLLSVNQANEFFASHESRVCRPDMYTKTSGVWTDDQGACRWWLRTHGKDNDRAAYVLTDGTVYPYGSYVDVDSYAVRAAVWMSI